METEMIVQRTLPQMFEINVAKYPHNILMWEKKGDSYMGTSYRETHAFGKMDYRQLPIRME